ncbi:MAG: TRAP transporter large permease [Betaproteobacteria bacterium]|nr:TRAP transporter large permease [Betaproteobacteria bacterium]
MSGPMIGLVGFACVLLLIALRVPVAISMGAVGAIGYGTVTGFGTLGFVVGRATFESVFPISLSVVPLFVMMGVFAGHGGLSRSLYQLVAAFIGHLRGGLAMATIGACALFGAVCGSSIATAATIGKIAMPEMRRLGYDDRLASASVAAGGTLGVMIPPSILFVVYGIMTETPIGALFVAGILPGILGTLLYMSAVSYMTLRNPRLGPGGPKATGAERLRGLRDVWQVVLLFAVVLGGMYVGWFSPTEAAGVGAFGAIILTAVSGRLTMKVLRAGFAETATTTAMIFMILIGATIFNYFLDAAGATQGLIDWVKAHNFSKYEVLLLLCVFYIILGCLMDSLSMILLTVGAVFPLIKAVGFDPIWFGVILVTLGEIGMITPPVGMNLFVLNATVPNLPLQTISRGILPFVTADVVRIIILVLFPAIAIWLPSFMGK